MEELHKILFSMADEEYRDFQSKLMPTVPKEKIIGIRIPVLRKFAKDFYKKPEAKIFLKSLPHKYYEEDNLHAFLLEHEKDFDSCSKAVTEFLPYVDNWATCDSISPKVFKAHKTELFEHIKLWIAKKDVYSVRFGIKMLMTHFLDDDFSEEYPKMVAKIKSDEYYIKMMQSWYFATALAKKWDETLPFLVEHRLEHWVHNKTIQKAIESYRITDEQKDFLRKLKI